MSSAVCGFSLYEEFLVPKHIRSTSTLSCLFHHGGDVVYGHIERIRCHLFKKRTSLYTHTCMRPCISWYSLFCPCQRLMFNRQGIAIKEMWQN